MESTLGNIMYYMREAERYTCPSYCRYLVGLKSDLKTKISDETLQEFVASLNLNEFKFTYLEVSSKSRDNVDLLFDECTARIFLHHQYRRNPSAWHFLGSLHPFYCISQIKGLIPEVLKHIQYRYLCTLWDLNSPYVKHLARWSQSILEEVKLEIQNLQTIP
eukprot:TRINITY_DN7471_c0_g1_i1.p1 TRINITY_DN7471_c0_g1~~TRINITY_DN7471_c0_g1_i1.p1  ORF type:complete len:162 (-),score=24.92 TRINITY_DN7471_c0_g1_i1:121-606(-)